MKETIRGRIVFIQEERFHLTDEKGRGSLFTLSHKASASVDDLERWHQDKTEVIVIYEGKPNLDSAVALSVNSARAP